MTQKAKPVFDRVLDAFGLMRTSRAETPSPTMDRLHRTLLNDWWPDREFNEKDFGERRLLAALILAYPDLIHTRQTCNCGEPDCEECLDESDVPLLLARAEAEFESERRTPT